MDTFDRILSEMEACVKGGPGEDEHIIADDLLGETIIALVDLGKTTLIAEEVGDKVRQILSAYDNVGKWYA